MSKTKAKERGFIGDLLRNFRTQSELWLISIPIVAWAIVFCYRPMYGILMAFFNYTPGRDLWNSEFVGLTHFTEFVGSPAFFQLLRNTLVMSSLNLTLGFLAPIVFALSLNEFTSSKIKKGVQTISYLPHFVSWVAAGSMIYTILSNEGALNGILQDLGFTSQPIPFLTNGKYYWAVFTIANIWKSLGWSSIIYLSAITGVDISLMEASSIDGAGRFRMVWHIVIPTILPTIVMLWILGIGNILNAGFDQHLILGNVSTQQYWDVIDTYAYRFGVQNGNYSLGTAVSLMKSVIGFSLVFITNQICKRKLSVSLF